MFSAQKTHETCDNFRELEYRFSALCLRLHIPVLCWFPLSPRFLEHPGLFAVAVIALSAGVRQWWKIPPRAGAQQGSAQLAHDHSDHRNSHRGFSAYTGSEGAECRHAHVFLSQSRTADRRIPPQLSIEGKGKGMGRTVQGTHSSGTPESQRPHRLGTASNATWRDRTLRFMCR